MRNQAEEVKPRRCRDVEASDSKTPTVQSEGSNTMDFRPSFLRGQGASAPAAETPDTFHTHHDLRLAVQISVLVQYAEDARGLITSLQHAAGIDKQLDDRLRFNDVRFGGPEFDLEETEAVSSLLLLQQQLIRGAHPFFMQA